MYLLLCLAVRLIMHLSILMARKLLLWGGSAWKFMEAIKEAGIVEQKEDRNYYVVKQKITFSDEEHGVDLIIYPDDHLSINVLIDYNSKILGNQYSILDNIDEFEEKISRSRTFVFFHELEPLFKMGLIKGGDLDNAIVILEKEVDQFLRLTVLQNCSIAPNKYTYCRRTE